MDDSVNAAVAYLGLGLVFVAAFHAVGLKRLDLGAAGAGWVFRLIITLGIVASWPRLVVLWVKHSGSDFEPGLEAGFRSEHERGILSRRGGLFGRQFS
jgi:hypothetical protein